VPTYLDARAHRGGGIYAVVGSGGRAWVGQSTQVAVRVRRHFRDRPWAAEAWLLEQLDLAEWDDDEVGELEQDWISRFEAGGWEVVNPSRRVNDFGGATVHRVNAARGGKIGGRTSGPVTGAANFRRLIEDWRGTDHWELAGSKGGKRANARIVQCGECDFASNPGNLGKHRERTGHQTSAIAPARQAKARTPLYARERVAPVTAFRSYSILDLPRTEQSLQPTEDSPERLTR